MADRPGCWSPAPTFCVYYRQRTASGAASRSWCSVRVTPHQVLADLAPELPAEFRTLDQSYGASLAECLFGVSLIGTLRAGHGCDLLTLGGRGADRCALGEYGTVRLPTPIVPQLPAGSPRFPGETASNAEQQPHLTEWFRTPPP